ncbi:hypothetical protein Hdeb2414_s0008g00283091 [Helianthus debilis subsp. tardiflorus]
MVKDLGKIESLLKGVDTVFQDESLIKEVTHKEAGDGGDKENVKLRLNERAMLAVEVQFDGLYKATFDDR